MTDTNADFMKQLLFEDPETGEELRLARAPVSEDGGLILVVMNKSGTRVWKHTIKTEEL